MHLMVVTPWNFINLEKCKYWRFYFFINVLKYLIKNFFVSDFNLAGSGWFRPYDK